MYMQKIGIVANTIGVYLFLAHTHTFLTLGTNLHFIRLAQTRANQAHSRSGDHMATFSQSSSPTCTPSAQRETMRWSLKALRAEVK